MLPIELQSPREIAITLADRVKHLRLTVGWTQEETAGRAGISLATYRQFERTGRISLERLIKLAVVLEARSGFAHLFEPGPASSLVELERRSEIRSRRRGRRRDAKS